MSPSNMPNPQSDDIDFGKLFGSLIDAKWYIALVTFIFAVMGITYSMLATPIYKADALIQVEEKQGGGISALISNNVGDAFSQKSSSSAEIAIIKSRMVLGKTVDDLDLTTVVLPDYFPFIGKGLARLRNQSLSMNISQFILPEGQQTASLILVITSIDPTHPAKGSYQVENNQGQVLFSGKTDSWAKGQGYRLFVTDFKAQIGDRFTLIKRTRFSAIQWLQGSLNLTEQGANTGIIRLSFTGEDPRLITKILNNISENYLIQNVERKSEEAEKSLVFLKQQLPQVKASLTLAEDKLNAYRLKHDSVDLDLEAKSKLSAMVQLEGKLNDLTFKESEISQRFTKEHPSYIALLDKRKILLSEKYRLEKMVQRLPETQQQILRLTRDVQVSQQIYLQMLNKIQELSVVKAGTVGNIRILDNAQAYSAPIAPRKGLVVASCAVIGFMLITTVILGIALFRRKLENPEEIEAIGLPVYASIPMSDWQISMEKKNKNIAKKTIADTLLTISNPADLSVEALRSLRTSLHFAMMEAKNNILMVSGPSPGIGKSFISANMAAVIAKAGQRVLVIDADMRKGRMERQMLTNSKVGLSDFLSGQKAINEIVKHPGVDNLDFISRGDVPPNPSELLMHPRMKELLDWASTNYDIVVIDTPPILAVTDAAIVGAHAGTTLLVGRFEQNTAKEVEITKQRFEQNGIEVKGFILNGVIRKASSYYGNYGYYNYSYSDKNK